MNYRSLGRTGVKVSPLCLGCMNFGGRTNEKESIEIIKHALDAGINFIDTANVYGHDPKNFSIGRGRSEEIVGKALKQTGQRKKVVLATKVYYPIGDGPNEQGSSRLHIYEQCAASLQRLQTDYIDLYQLHSPNVDIPIDETLRALDDLIRRGWIRYIGTSSFPSWKLLESFWVSKEYGLNRFICEQPAYNLLDRRIERELVPLALSYGVAIINWSPLAGGFLTGKYHRGRPPQKGSRFDAFWVQFGKEHLVDEVFDVLDEIEKLSSEKGCTSSQLALAWCINQPGITSAIIGPRTIEQLDDCLKALTITFTEEDLKRLDKIVPPGRMKVPYYKGSDDENNSWGPHQYGW